MASLSNDLGESARLRPTNGASRPAEQMQAQAPRAASEGLLSVIGADILVTGNIEAEVDLQIEGRVIGDVRCATLVLGERSSVEGNIFARRTRISGRVEGSVETTDLAVEAGARVKGEVTYSRLRVANGGLIEGSMTYRPLAEEEAEEDRPAAAGPAPARSPAGGPKVHYIE